MPTIDYISKPYTKSVDRLSHNNVLLIKGEHMSKLEFALVFVLVSVIQGESVDPVRPGWTCQL